MMCPATNLVLLTLGFTPNIAVSAASLLPHPPPDVFDVNLNIGPTNRTESTDFKDSPHFRIYDSPTEEGAIMALSVLEASYSCFVEDLGWRSSGLSSLDPSDDDGLWTKTNVFSTDLLSSGGRVRPVPEYGLSYMKVHPSYLQGDEIKPAALLAHEFSHVLTLAERATVGGGLEAWHEAMGNYFQDLYKTSPLCEGARTKHGRNKVQMDFNLKKNLEESFRVIVDATMDPNGQLTPDAPANFYFAWPFLTYLTYNPDEFPGLGTNIVRDLIRRHSGQRDETPLHTLAKIAGSISVGEIVARYWARMAYIDIGHPTGTAQFLGERDALDFDNYDAVDDNTWRVKASRAPRYMGANITPLQTNGTVTVDLLIETDSDEHRATVTIRNTLSGAVRYERLVNGSGSITVSAHEEATLVVARAPDALLVYNPFNLEADEVASRGLAYTVEIIGARL